MSKMVIGKKRVEFRIAEEKDIPEILALLKSGLGENVTPKTEAYWRWKHIQNPFGPSHVLLAVSNDTIIGVRSFMRWQWRLGNEILEAVRGVDTVIKPEYQGNGLFGELTLKLVDESFQYGYDFLYSTPNEKSKRGYQRLGWNQIGILPISVKLVKPWQVFLNLVTRPGKPDVGGAADQSLERFLSRADLPSLLLASHRNFPEKLVTAHTVDSLQWRYAEVPVGSYFAFGVERLGALKGLCFCRVKRTVAGMELRITDIFVEHLKYHEDLRRELRDVIRERKIHYVTSGCFGANDILSGWLLIKKKRLGPVVTARNIKLKNLKTLNEFSDWSPSLGDLELF